MPLTIGLVGCGIWGRNILRELVALDCHVVVVDPSEASRSDALRDGAMQAHATLPSSDIYDGFIVAAPATLHAEVIASLLDHQVPVFCEKPLTTDVGGAERLVKQAGDRLFVMHIWRYHPGIQRLGEIARSGELGTPYLLRTIRTNWTSPRRDTDSVWTMVPHDLSIAIAVLGDIPPPRFAWAERIGDRVTGLVGVLGTEPALVLEVSNRYADKRREVRLHCSNAVAVLPGDDRGVIEITRSDPDNDLLAITESESVPYQPPLRSELEVFVSHLRGGAPPPTTAHEGLQVVRAVAQLRRLAGVDV